MLFKALVRPLGVVISDIFRKNILYLVPVNNNEMIEGLSPHGTDKPFRYSVHVRRANGYRDPLHAEIRVAQIELLCNASYL